MALQMDPEVATAMAPLAEAAAGITPPPAGDWQTRRAAVDALIAQLGGGLPRAADVTATEHSTTRDDDGHTIAMRLYRKADSAPGSLVVYVHGGGMIAGTVDAYDPVCRHYTAESGVPLLSVEYRLAPEHPHPVPVEDAYTALRWAIEHADELGVSPDRIAIMGDSAGGGIAAGVALLARDRGGPAPAFQILVYPMIDDRTLTPDPFVEPLALWTTDDNVTGWGCLLRDAAGGPDTAPYAAPARAQDLSGLPPAYIDVGQLDVFRAEDTAYAERLGKAGVDVEFHLHQGVPHGFEILAPESAVARRAMADRMRVLRAL